MHESVLGKRLLHTSWSACASRLSVGHTRAAFSSPYSWQVDGRVAVQPVAAQYNFCTNRCSGPVMPATAHSVPLSSSMSVRILSTTARSRLKWLVNRSTSWHCASVSVPACQRRRCSSSRPAGRDRPRRRAPVTPGLQRWQRVGRVEALLCQRRRRINPGTPRLRN